MLKVAVCISGVFRGNLEELKELNEKLIKPLNADVFIATWDAYFPHSGSCGSIANFFNRTFGPHFAPLLKSEYRLSTNFKKIFPSVFRFYETPHSIALPTDTIKAILSPQRILICDQKKFENFVCAFDEKMWNINPMYNWKNTLKMYFQIHCCNKELENYEEAIGEKYDITIRIRPDLKLLSPITLDLLSNLKEQEVLTNVIEWGIDDSLFIARTSTMNKIADLWKEMSRTKLLSPFKNFPHARTHLIFPLWLFKNKIQVIEGYFKTNLTYNSLNSIPDFRKELKQDFENIKDQQLKQDVQKFVEELLTFLDKKYTNNTRSAK